MKETVIIVSTTDRFGGKIIIALVWLGLVNISITRKQSRLTRKSIMQKKWKGKRNDNNYNANVVCGISDNLFSFRYDCENFEGDH